MCICTTLLYPFICQWTSKLLPCSSYCKLCYNEQWDTCVFFNFGLPWSGIAESYRGFISGFYFSIGRLNFSLSILLLYSLLFIIVSYTPLYFCIVCCKLFFFISNIVDLILPFFLMSLAKGLSVLFIFSKKQFLVLLIFTIVSLISFSFISAWIFMIYFLLLILVSILLFLFFFFFQLF